MHIALLEQQTVNLHSCERTDFQKIYTASVHGRVTCMHCGTSVRLRLGIFERPRFIHPPTDFDCESVVETFDKVERTKATKELDNKNDGFTIPKHRSITGEDRNKQKDNWKEPEVIKAFTPFEEDTNDISPLEPHPYYQQLAALNYPLDSRQWEAVTTVEGPLLILAGAGSGKTRVLTSRAAYMMTEKNIPANRLGMVTFTAKAAKEMKERMLLYPNLTRQHLQSLVVGTFHSIFYKMLLHHQPDQWQPNQLLKWDWQRDKLMKEAGREIDLDEKEFAYDQALAQIGLWKNSLVSPADVKAKDIWEERVLHLYKRYEEMKNQNQMFDFDDMLIGCYNLLTDNPALLEKYQERFSYLLIDEFQDINHVQYEIIKHLAASHNNLCVVGDDDQSIYGFRGSNPTYILNFKNDYHQTKTVILNRNYRSTHPIVSVSNRVIKQNKNRYTKDIKALSDSSEAPTVFFPYDEEEEATMIVTDIKERIEKGANPNDFAILYRTNVSMRALFERLVQSSLPFTIEQEGDSFYRRKTVRKVLAYMRLAKNPDDTEAMGDLIGALFLKQTALQDLKAHSITSDCTIVEALSKLTNLQPFQQKKLKKIVPLFKRVSKLTPLKAIDLIEREMGLQDYLKKQGNEGNAMEKGSDDVRDLKVAAKNHHSISDFLDHVNHMIAKNEEMKHSKNKQSDGLQLMTIHRSKGLEFKHVYIIGAVDGSIPHDFALEAWRDGDDTLLEEERRLMYVAMTRAQTSLMISVPNQRRGKKAYRSRFVRDMFKQAYKSAIIK
ncbi:ATP-dependent helicase [Desertibacillus haloalkaliphilus]|uniref:ATP-dependent helicase n=1 Tax=Desertibacillus haloalkaliphilus TaxID=1328930 RepID=UPI001C25C8F1|nr:ATP-dependent helicase [Desertibacillus haloalkaliphilus]MBU8906887.1 ATP-dependent helicase [Desertibacillus haloalkaliphilus]